VIWIEALDGFLAQRLLFFTLGINAGRIMTCLSKGNICENKMKPPAESLVVESVGRISTSVVSPLTPSLFSHKFYFGALFVEVFCVCCYLFYLLLLLMAHVSGSARLDVALLNQFHAIVVELTKKRWR
jgi:hypothetical protein